MIHSGTRVVPILILLPLLPLLNCRAERDPGSIILFIEPESSGELLAGIETLLVVIDPLYPFLDEEGEQYSEGDTYGSGASFTDILPDDPEMELLLPISMAPYREEGVFPVLEFTPGERSRSPYRFQVLGEDSEGVMVAESSLTPFLYIMEGEEVSWTLKDLSFIEEE